jgi:hypothetical protein
MILYLVYMASFGLSFWSLVIGVANIRREILPMVTLSNPVRYRSVAGSLLQPLVFYPLWISALLPLMQTGQKSASIYSVYILELCFIMLARYYSKDSFALSKEQYSLIVSVSQICYSRKKVKRREGTPKGSISCLKLTFSLNTLRPEVVTPNTLALDCYRRIQLQHMVRRALLFQNTFSG